jgi:hypothetical protein
MSSLATAVIGGAVVGGMFAKKGAEKQADATTDATAMQVEESRRQYDQTREDFAPWREMGMEAIDMLNDPLANFYESPDYQFRKEQGMEGIGATFAARGGGGNALRALNEFNSNLAAGEFGNWYGRTMGRVESGRGATGGMVAANQAGSNAINAAYGNQGAQLSSIYGNKYANINNAMQGGISNMLYAKQAGLI